jgi:hypothetical protein
MSILWTIIIGFVAGVIAKFLHPGSNEPWVRSAGSRNKRGRFTWFQE